MAFSEEGSCLIDLTPSARGGGEHPRIVVLPAREEPRGVEVASPGP